MNVRNIVKGTTLVAGAVILGSSPAFATMVQIPEPSILSLYGAGIAGLVIAGRWMRRK